MLTMLERFAQGQQFLAANGLNLLASFETAALPEAIATPMLQSGVPLHDYGRLLLVGHGGRQLWNAAQRQAFNPPDPIDSFSVAQITTFMQTFVKDAAFKLLYPFTDFWIPLQQLGELAGWAHPSPIGSGISPTYGLWFAYRAALLTNAPLPIAVEQKRPSPCESCADKPCQTACPATAVSAPNQFQLQPCINHRLQPASSCAAQCLARLACPVAPQHRYTTEQIQYHYRLSLETIMR